MSAAQTPTKAPRKRRTSSGVVTAHDETSGGPQTHSDAAVASKPGAQSRWASRIVGEASVNPSKLIANPLNFRRHPKAQQVAMDGVLDEIGWIQRVIVNERTGNIIDGHLRVERALAKKEKLIPVCYVDLSDDEERIALATFDPISAMALTDQKMFDELVQSIGDDHPALVALFEKESEENSVTSSSDQSDELKRRYQILITLSDEDEQAQLLFRLSEEGYECRSLIS